MLKKVLGKNKARNFFVGFFSCLCFIVLAVYGWGVSIQMVLAYFVVMVGLLLGLMLVAMGCGWLLSLVNRWRNKL